MPVLTFFTTTRYLFAQDIAGQLMLAEFCVILFTVDWVLSLGQLLLFTVALLLAVQPAAEVTVTV
jgi:hypothetical protein